MELVRLHRVCLGKAFLGAWAWAWISSSVLTMLRKCHAIVAGIHAHPTLDHPPTTRSEIKQWFGDAMNLLGEHFPERVAWFSKDETENDPFSYALNVLEGDNMAGYLARMAKKL